MTAEQETGIKLTYTDCWKSGRLNLNHYWIWILQDFGSVYLFGASGNKWERAEKHLRIYSRITGRGIDETRDFLREQAALIAD